jgi:2,4-dienoyl-CoA reductase-like NADH-dependent reductase (Old Yellow Enzyme family)
MRFPRLFTPVAIRGRRAPNRIMRSATTSNLGERNRVGARMLALYDSQAAGGVGSIVTENLVVDPALQPPPGTLTAADDDAIPGLRRLAETVHAHGALLIGQLGHGGRQHLGRAVPPLLRAPSAIACPHSGGVPHALEAEEIADLISAFARAASRCIEAGLDGVELHGAQGHLIQQFLSPLSNHRHDGYGGSATARERFPREVIAAVRAAIGEAILGYRMGVSEFCDGGLALEDTTRIAAGFAADGIVDYYSLSQGNFATIETHLPDRHYGQPAFPDLHRRIKASSGRVLVAAGGRVQTPEQAEAILAAGDADLVTLTRALLVDPDWPAKAAGSRHGPIRRCIGCNQCWGTTSDGGPIRCTTNPVVGRELLLGPLQPAETPRRILIVGAGPAGLETARVAARRGHRVTILERASQPGGKLVRAQLAPYQAELRHVLDFLLPEIAAAGVELRTGIAATAETIAAEQPDTVVLATGAAIVTPALPGDGSVPVLVFDGGPCHVPGQGAIIVMDEDGYYWGAAAAEAMAATARRVLLVTRFFEVLREVPITARIPVLRTLDEHGTELRPNMFVAGAERGAAVLQNFRSGRRTLVPDVSAIIWVGQQQAEDRLAAPLRARGLSAHLIGDAYAPRRLVNALQDAHDLGRNL